MHGVYTVAQVRAAEDALLATTPEGALMARAAGALAVQCVELLGRCYGARVVLLVGAGNNGGDALYAGAALARRGAAVTALLLDQHKAHRAGLEALCRAGGRIQAADPGAVGGADLVVDGMLGIGGSGDLRPPAAALAEAATDQLTIAVDLPSGVDADTGAADDSAVWADVTVTFGALKPGLLVGDGVAHAGQVRLVDIGLALPSASTFVLEQADVAALLPEPTAADDKYRRGVVGVIAGSAGYPGAGVLSTGSARLAGAGMVRYLGTAGDQIRARFPDVVVQDGRPSEQKVQAWAIGPGMGTDDAALALVRDVLGTDHPAVVDADAVTLCGQHPEVLAGRTAATVVTPHDSEFVRVAGSDASAALRSDRLGAARAAASRLGATVLLKGDATIVADPDGRAYVNPTGTSWLATAGSGDVLTGLIGSLLAAGLPTTLAAAAGAYVHGVAGQLAAVGGPPTALDVLDHVRPALAAIADGSVPAALGD